MRHETVGPHTYELVALESFEATFGELFRHVRGRLDPTTREDLAPMFGVIWGSCRAVAERLEARGPALADATVLELACGLALPSLVAARHGARVLATDQHPHTAAFLERNLARNRIRGVTYRHLDLRDPPPVAADLVIASDVLFAAPMAGIVAGAFDALLRPGAEGWLADPGRAWLGEFVEEAEARGLEVHDAIDRVDTPTGTEDVFVLTLRRV